MVRIIEIELGPCRDVGECEERELVHLRVATGEGDSADSKIRVAAMIDESGYATLELAVDHVKVSRGYVVVSFGVTLEFIEREQVKVLASAS